MAMVRKKQDDKYLEALRELITTGGGNRQCFDCGQKGPTYVNMTIGSFVCTRCSGVLRGITPPHRVKSISMATFTQDEIDFLKSHGNDVCAKTWLGLWDPKRAVHQDQRELMIDKYERKRYYLEPASPLKSLTNATNLKTTTAAAAAAAAATSSASSSSATASSANSSQNNNNNNNNNKTQIQLTPPTSQRTTANGLHKTSSTAISRPQHTTHNSHNQNGFSSSLSSNNTDAFGLHNGLNSSVGSMSTGALSDTSSCASANGFGAEADFVADFGSADIFNATGASSPASSIGSSTTNNNGYAKIQPLKISTAAHQQFMNGHGGGGGGSGSGGGGSGSVNNHNTNLQNGSNSNGNTENFADFEHAPIYNAAVEEGPNYQFVRKNAIRKKSTSSISGSIIRRNERQLKDILEMDTNENSVDYINFNEDSVLNGTKTNASQSSGYSNLFDDFDAFLTLDDNRPHVNFQNLESDYANVAVKGGKFTPLALAAHATAMAVLGNKSHFNTQHQTSEISAFKPFTNEWDAWNAAAQDVTATQSSTIATTMSRFPSNNLIQQPYEVPQQKQQPTPHAYASLGNFNSQQKNFPSSTFSSPSSATTFETGKTTITNAVPLQQAIATTPPTISSFPATCMFKKNTTNPFRMHLDVNDNYNTINYDNDYYFNNYDTTNNITPTAPTLTATETTSANTPTANTDFNVLNFNDFNFVTNSILSYDIDVFSTAAIATTTTTAATPSTQNYHTVSNAKQNSKINSINDNDNYVEQDNDVVKNPFLCKFQQTPSTCTTFDSTTNSFANSQKNPFKMFATTTTDHNTLYTLQQHTVVDDKANNIQSNCYRHENNNNYPYDSTSNLNNENNTSIEAGKDVANSFCPNANQNNYFNSKLHSHSNSTLNSYAANANANSKQKVNNYQNDNDNYNNDNDNDTSWRLPINNNNNKNSTTNGFNNNNINNNIINNNNSSAPAEDRYAALKDLDEQLRESKAVAAQAASIVTANVVDSGFGNPNANGTVNPFAAHHHHHHQQAAVVNPFQNASNNPTQNTTQQLFGQMTLIPNGIAAANGFLNAQKTHTANTGFFNYTASGFTNANTPQIQHQQQQQHQTSLMYPTSVQAGPNGCGFGFGTLQQQIASTGTGLTTNTFNNPFAATGALNSNNPFL